MATSAFKSNTKRSSIGAEVEDAASSNRRSRSLSVAPRRGKFVNTVRGSEFPENEIISNFLDNHNHFFPLKDDPASSQSQNQSQSQNRRGRSVSRHHSRVVDDGKGRGIVDNNNNNIQRRRRSVSVARYHQFSDSESEKDQSLKSIHRAKVKSFDSLNYKKPSVHKPVTPNHRLLRRSLSQKDLSKSREGYSSHSSALTDDEARDTRSNKNGTERTIRAVYSQKKTDYPTGDGGETGLYEVMRKELRHVVEEIRTELQQGIVKAKHSVLASDDCLQSNDSDVLQVVSVIRKNYTTKLEQSEKRKQDLLAEIVVEEQRGRELSKIVKELLPEPKNTAVQEKLSLGRKNNDRNRMSKCLTEDAERYFDDFISNIEDTDISSFDGERSDASSTIRIKKPRDLILHSGERETDGFPSRTTSLPVEMDGVVLPWLQWETSNDGSPLLSKSKVEVPVNPQDNLCDSAQGENGSNHFNGSSRASWSPGGGSPSVFSGDAIGNRFEDHGSYFSQSAARGPKESYLDMDEYLHIQQSEEIAFEGWRQRQRISSGALILCSRSCLHL